MITWLKSNHQAITAIGAMVVGVVALYVAWDQSRVMRAQQHGAVVPALQIDAFTRTDGPHLTVGVHVANNGVGPAFIRSVNVLNNGEPTQDISGMFAALPSEQLDRSWYTMTDRVIAPGDSVTPISVQYNVADITTDMMAVGLAEWESWEVEVCYCSVFDRCWLGGAQDRARREVAACPAPGPDIFELYGSESFRAAITRQATDTETVGEEQ